MYSESASSPRYAIPSGPMTPQRLVAHSIVDLNRDIRAPVLTGGGYNGVDMSQKMLAGHLEEGNHSYDFAYSGRTVPRNAMQIVETPVIVGNVRYLKVASLRGQVDDSAYGFLGPLDPKHGVVANLAGVGNEVDFYTNPEAYPRGNPASNVQSY